MSISEVIQNLCSRYLGVREIPENLGFHDLEFQHMIELCGWKVGNAWCALTGELIWKEAYSPWPDVIDELNKLFSANAQKTYTNFKADPNWETSSEPVIGALVIWAYEGSRGHLGIVCSISDKAIITFEGNSGNMTKFKKHYWKEDKQIMGFIIPREM